MREKRLFNLRILTIFTILLCGTISIKTLSIIRVDHPCLGLRVADADATVNDRLNSW